MPKLTSEEYVKAGALVCPACGSTNISAGEFNVDGRSGWQEVVCHSCHSSWNDTFSMTGYAELVAAETEDNDEGEEDA